MSWPRKEEILEGVASMLKTNLAVRPGEKVLIMTDPPTVVGWRQQDVPALQTALERCYLARLVADLAAEFCPEAETEFLPFPMTDRSGSEPDAATAAHMCSADVIVAITNHSLTHTQAATQACAARARMASMPGFVARMFEGPMTADYQQIAIDSQRAADLLSTASQAVLTCPQGTDLVIDLEGRCGEVDVGLITETGKLDNLPGGEAYIAPVEGASHGRLVVTPRGFPTLEEPMSLFFEAGMVCDLQGGGAVGDGYRRLLELPAQGRQMERRNLAELGIGTNPKAASIESLLEAEKIKGTVHVAIGDNAHMGGVVEADLHQDFVVWEPDLALDGRLIIRAGQWVI